MAFTANSFLSLQPDLKETYPTGPKTGDPYQQLPVDQQNRRFAKIRKFFAQKKKLSAYPEVQKHAKSKHGRRRKPAAPSPTARPKQ